MPVPLDGSFVPPKPRPQDTDVQLVAKAEQAYLEAKLQRAVHKEFRFETLFKAWGAEIDGVAGKVGAPLAIRRQVWMLLQRIVTGGWASCDVLRQVLGNLAYIFQYRRELYSLQHRIYKFVSEMPVDRWCKLPDFVLDELRSCALHLPFAVCSLRRRVSTTLLATDATPSSGGAVVTEVPGALAEELWRQSEMKGEAVRLDRGRDEALDVEEPKVPSVFASTLGECLPWQVTASYHFRETSHVNLQELRAWRREMMKIAAQGDHKGCIVVALNDSRVVVGAVGKGRSSSFRLNNLLRGALPHMILGGLSGALLWIETAANPADYPSRFRALPPPRRVPGWLLNFGMKDRVPFLGREVCVQEARATQAHSGAGVEMREPLDLTEAGDLQIATLFEEVTRGLVRWVWLEPSALYFVTRGHLAQDGPQGPSGRPRGGERRLQAGFAEHAWDLCLQLAWAALRAGGYFVLVGPRRCKAWGSERTQELATQGGVTLWVVGCSHDANSVRTSVPGPSMRMLTNAPWAQDIKRELNQLRCGGDSAGDTGKGFRECSVQLSRTVANACIRWAAAQC